MVSHLHLSITSSLCYSRMHFWNASWIWIPFIIHTGSSSQIWVRGLESCICTSHAFAVCSWWWWHPNFEWVVWHLILVFLNHLITMLIVDTKISQCLNMGPFGSSTIMCCYMPMMQSITWSPCLGVRVRRWKYTVLPFELRWDNNAFIYLHSTYTVLPFKLSPMHNRLWAPCIEQRKEPKIMSDPEIEKHIKSVRLTSSNYNIWAIDLQGKLMMVNAWRIITKDFKKPVDTEAAEKWLLKQEEAASIILKSLTSTQYVHIKGIMDDPIEMWNRLRSAHQSQVVNSQFHAMQKLLSIWKDNGELMDYITQINTATNDLISLALSILTVQNVIDEIGIHATIAGLDHDEYGAFTSSYCSVSLIVKPSPQPSGMRTWNISLLILNNSSPISSLEKEEQHHDLHHLQEMRPHSRLMLDSASGTQTSMPGWRKWCKPS